MRRFIYVLVLCVICFPLTAQPKLSVIGGRVYNCGNVTVGDSVSHQFVLRNAGNTELVIHKINKTCNCTDATIESTVVAPGDSTTLTVVVDTENKNGYTAVDVVLVTNTDQVEHVIKMVMDCKSTPCSLSGDREVRKTVKKASRDFARNYAKDFGSRMLFTYTVKANGKYREMIGCEGLFLSLKFNQRSTKAGRIKDKNRCKQWYLSNCMHSYAWNSEGTDTIPSRNMNAGGRAEIREQLLSGYRDNPSFPNVLDYKRTLEVCSPLNPKHLDHYIYWVENASDNENVIIGFKTKAGAFPKKVRLFAEGHLTIDASSNRFKEIRVLDQVDYWAQFPRRKAEGIPVSYTSHWLSVRYVSLGRKIASAEAEMEIAWKDPGKESGADYYLSTARRRRAFEVGQEENQHILFFDHRLVRNKVNKWMKAIGEVGYQRMLAPYDPQRWTPETVPWLDWEVVRLDLEESGISLDEQSAVDLLLGGMQSPTEHEKRQLSDCYSVVNSMLYKD